MNVQAESLEPSDSETSPDLPVDRESGVANARAAITIMALLATVMFVAYAATPEGVAVGNQRPAILTGVNPNFAAWPELVLLPGIGETKARAIVDYRKSVCRDGLSGCAMSVYERPIDLEKVRGIGPKTADRMTKHLRFRGP